ncbi:cation:proton antiporter domain-containing protein, partial [Nocardiopsis halotolerans]|uniref:cation:proton antiporter domain-containing protein n=1 Tax=Nocardiopsis halotolerans TaxID=124252 RepID=UPI0003807B39
MDPLPLVYATIGTLSVILALFSEKIRALPLSEPLLALLLGAALGPYVVGLLPLPPETRGSLLLEGTRILLAASVMTAALRFPATSLRGLAPQVALLLCVVMPIAAVISGAAALTLGLPLALAVLVGVCLCPTDPVLAASVVTGKPAQRDLPARLRKLLTVESGINDGLALALVGIAVAVVLPSTGPGDVAGRLVWEILGGAAVGVVLGA